jgi:hypothetical protein
MRIINKTLISLDWWTWRDENICTVRKLHSSCCKGFLITICTTTSLAALSLEGAVTAHLLFGYPVEDEEDVDDINPIRCEINKEQKYFLFEVSVIFCNKFISNDCVLMETILELLK